MSEANLRLGILGGTFDPIHLGHLQIAEIALDLASLDEVHFVTSVHPPHKSEKTKANFLDRHAMVALALRKKKRFLPSSIEADRPGKSYSIDTLRYYRRIAGPKGELFFIIGLDAFLEIESWKEYEQFPGLCSFLVFARPGFRAEELSHAAFPSQVTWKFLDKKRKSLPSPSPGPGMYLVRRSTSGISSTDIRHRVRQGLSISRFVPTEVEDYIDKVGLYRRSPSYEC
ncbi:MAG: nicotinate-nucleotide adenylyltransferase [Terriglobia bacterium]